MLKISGRTLDFPSDFKYYTASECVADTCEACDRRRTCGGSSFFDRVVVLWQKGMRILL